MTFVTRHPLSELLYCSQSTNKETQMIITEEYELRSDDRPTLRAFRKSVSDGIRKSITPTGYYITQIRFDVNESLFVCALIVTIEDSTEQHEKLNSVLDYYTSEHKTSVRFVNSQVRRGT